MIRLSQLTIGSLHGHGDGPRLEADGDRGAALRRHRHRLTPARLLEVAERADHADELGFRLELTAILPRFRGLELELFAPDQLAAQGRALIVEEREEVGAVERRDRLQLVDPHHDGRRASGAVGIDVRVDGDRAAQQRRAAATAGGEQDAAQEQHTTRGPAWTDHAMASCRHAAWTRALAFPGEPCPRTPAPPGSPSPAARA